MPDPLIGSSEMFRLVLDISSGGLIMMTPAGAIVLINRAMESRFGYPPGELVGQPIDRLLAEFGDLRERAGRLPAQGATAAAPLHYDAIGRRKDGSPIRVGVALSTVQTLEGSFIFVSVGDTGTEASASEVADRAFAEPFAFEHFVAELSSTFINAPADGLTTILAGALGRIADRFAIDAGAVFASLDGKPGAQPAAAWLAPGLSSSDQERSVPPGVAQRVQAGEIVAFASRDDPALDERDRAAYAAAGVQSGIVLPLWSDGRAAGLLELVTLRAPRTWPPSVLDRLTLVAGVLAHVIERQQHDEALRMAVAEAERLKEQLRLQTQRTRRSADDAGPSRIVGQSLVLKRVLEQVHKVATTDSTVLLLGETGTGKELFAAEIHELSARSGRPMVRVNCAAIPATLIESELFGREKGAYTGALARQIGRFELAHQSTIFLDEIGDLPLEVQVKLLRVLEEKRVERLGSPRSISVDTRVIAATHRNLEQRITDGTFRQDLYYRLNVFPIYVPPLRERQEDIPLLVWRFVEEFSRAFGKRVDAIDRDNIIALQQYAWPGNIRELRNVVERALISATGRRLSIPVPPASVSAMRRSPRLVDVEKEHIRGVLEGTGWRIRGVGGAADKLGMKPTTLETRMAKLGLKRPGRV